MPRGSRVIQRRPLWVQSPFLKPGACHPLIPTMATTESGARRLPSAIHWSNRSA